MHRPPPAPFTDPPHSHFRPLLVVLAGCAALYAAPAGADELTVFNHSTVDIVGIAGNPARVDGFQTILAGGNGRVQVGMPEGQCETRLDITFADGSRTEALADVCTGMALRLTESY